MSLIYRDRERIDDNRTSFSGTTRSGTKVTRYIVKDDFDETRSARSRFDDRRTDYDRGDARVEETRILRTSREEDLPQSAPSRAYSARDPGYARSRETISVRRDESPGGRREHWREPPGGLVEDRELTIRRTVERDDGNRERDLAVSRVDDRRESRFSDYEVVSPPRGSFDERDREVQRYVRTSEYYQPPAAPPPQTIIIRQEPIIIRERPREEDYQIVKKSDVEEERSVARRSEPKEEEYFYEKKVRERIPSDDRGERRLTRREVSPGDSISQVGRRGRDRGYESDDSMVYVRKEKITEGYSSDDEPHRKRDLAAGVVAGVGAAELIRRHHEKEGKEVSHGGGRIIKDVGAGIVGAVAAEGIRRYRSKSRHRGSRSRSRSHSRDRYSRRHHSRSRSRSRSRSNSNLKNIGGLGLAAAAVAAGALIASRNKKGASPDGGRRSRSRTRRHSRSRSRASSRASLENDPDATDDRNPGVRNKRTAAAGALGAAAMALYERHRSKSRGRNRSGSPNRFKQGVPIVGAGLAAAGLAHMYEKRKAREEASDIIKGEHRRSRSRSSRSRSRPRTESTYFDGPQRSVYSDPNLISYGNEPLHGSNYGEGYYGRPGVEQDYYTNNTRDMVPAPAPVPPPATSSFDATSRRPRSTSRTRSLSSGSGGHSRSRSRGAAAAAAAVGAGVAASELDARRKEKKERKRRSRDRRRSREGSYAPYTQGRDPYEDANWHATHSASYSQGMNDPYASHSGFYSSTSQFPPPPGSMPQQGGYAPQQPPPPGQPAYVPQDFPPPPSGAPQAQQPYFNPYAPGQNPYAPRNRGTDEIVSAATFSAPTDQPTSNGVSNLRQTAMSPPIVGPNVTVQRPSIDTPPAQQPSSRFPGDPTSPFQKPPPPGARSFATDDPRPGAVSPGALNGAMSSVPPDSRAAQTYTPPPTTSRSERGGGSPARHQPRDIPIVTDRPSPVPQKPQVPEDPRVTAFRNAAYAAPPVDQNDATTQGKQPEMQQTNRGNIPFMPSPDIRPPSDPSLPLTQQQPVYMNQNDSAPLMPSLVIPDMPASSSYLHTQERQARDRSRSQSASPRSAQKSGDNTPRAISPVQEQPRKSVTFAPKPEFSDAPPSSIKDRAASDSEAEHREAARRRRHEREKERDRDRHRRQSSRERHGYDAGDDFSDDTPFEDHRRRSHDRDRDRERDRDRGNRHGSRRERSNTQSLDRESASARDRESDWDKYRDPKRSKTVGGSSARSSQKDRHRDHSAGSDSTVDLPERFDNHGRRKHGAYGDSRSPEEEILAEKLDQILGGLFGGSSRRH